MTRKSSNPLPDDQQPQEDEQIRKSLERLEHLKSDLLDQSSDATLPQARFLSLLSELADLIKRNIDLYNRHINELEKVTQAPDERDLPSAEPSAARPIVTEGLRLKNPDDELDQYLAERMEIYDQIEDLEEWLDVQPLETVRGVGTVRKVVENGVEREELQPDAIQIGRRIYLFMPGEDEEVPQLVAAEYRLFCRERERLQKYRKQAS